MVSFPIYSSHLCQKTPRADLAKGESAAQQLFQSSYSSPSPASAVSITCRDRCGANSSMNAYA